MSGLDLDTQTSSAEPADSDFSLGEALGAATDAEARRGGTDLSEPLLQPLLRTRSVSPPEALPSGVTLGTLVAIDEDGHTPLIVHSAAPGTALRARTTVDLHAAHIGQQVVMLLEHGAPACPIVIGVLRGGEGALPNPKSEHVEIEADGDRLLVTAKHQIVLRCGKASITLTAAGKVLIDGTYLSSRSSGVNRIRGGSVQLN